MTRRPVDLPMDGDAFDAFLKDMTTQYGGRKNLTARRDAVSDLNASWAK
jgi:hypothetical protein